MLKVRLVPMTLLVPVIDNSGDHDCKMDEQRYAAMNSLLTNLLEYVSSPSSTETVRQGVSRNAAELRDSMTGVTQAMLGSAPDEPYPAFTHYERMHGARKNPPPVSQVDPVIDTTVRDSEMRSSVPEMSLEELRERPERTRSPPRPRANSWRHNE